ncbi:MAG: ABC transporter substrate-binding protein, partial [Rhodospirillaceae bacterium]
MLIALGILRPEDPLKGVVGMMGEYPLLDPAGFALWQRHFPAGDGIPAVGKASGDTFNAEAAIALKPDVAVFALAGHGPSPKAAALVERLQAAGVAVVFIDFFRDPLVNTTRSVRLLGEILGRQERADAFAKAYDTALAAVDARIAGVSRRPLVFLENRVGLQAECCASVGTAVIGNLIDRAGGQNLGSDLISGNSGLVGLEYLLGHQPDVYIGTAIGNPLNRISQPARIQAGPGVSAEQARASLANSLKRNGIAQLDAVRQGRAYAIWHHFFHSPFNVVAVQAMAKWFHPQAFADLDPQVTLADFMARFQPFAATGAYWAEAR